MTTTQRREPRRRLDLANAVVVLIGVLSGIVAYYLITFESVNALVIVPSIVVATMSATNLVKREAPREK